MVAVTRWQESIVERGLVPPAMLSNKSKAGSTHSLGSLAAAGGGKGAQNDGDDNDNDSVTSSLNTSASNSPRAGSASTANSPTKLTKKQLQALRKERRKADDALSKSAGGGGASENNSLYSTGSNFSNGENSASATDVAEMHAPPPVVVDILNTSQLSSALAASESHSAAHQEFMKNRDRDRIAGM